MTKPSTGKPTGSSVERDATSTTGASKLAIAKLGRTNRNYRSFSLAFLAVMILLAGLLLARYRDRLRLYFGVTQSIPTDFDVDSGRNILWSTQVGSTSYAGPVVAGGKVYVGTNNANGFLNRYPASVDLGVLLCFDASGGNLLWQASHEKLPMGRVHDWPMQGLTCTPHAEGDRLWYVSNRSEVVCLDVEGFYDNQDDGILDRFDVLIDRKLEADTVWRFDMMAELGVSPTNASSSRVAVSKDMVFVVTGNGVDGSHIRIPAPDAPSFIALDKKTGKLIWSDNSPGQNVLHGQWAGPTYAVLGGVPQVIFPGGDGWLYSFDPRGTKDGRGKLLWKFDCNPKDSQWLLGGRATRNNLLTPPTIHKGRVYMTVGQDPEHGEGPGRVWCIDPTKRGDVSAELVFNKADPSKPLEHQRLLACDQSKGDFVRPNPNSAVVWEYTGTDIDRDGAVSFDETMHRSLSRVVIKDNMAFVTCYSGLLHCIHLQTGQGMWTHDLFSAVWSSPLVTNTHVYVTDEDGDVEVFNLAASPGVAMPNGAPLSIANVHDSGYATPCIANDVLYVLSRKRLFAIANEREEK